MQKRRKESDTPFPYEPEPESDADYEPEPESEADAWPEDEYDDGDYFQDAPSVGAKVTSAEPVCEDTPYPRYRPGIYQARCTAVNIYRDPRFRRHVARLKFRLVPEGGIVFAFLNLGSGEKPKVARGSEYRRAWIIANGEQPRKRQTVSKRVFINKIFRVEIGDVTKRHDGREHHNAEIYSTVKEIKTRLWP